METEKVYWTISEVSEMIGINNSNIRFWEGEFDWFKPKRNKKGRRKFTKKDIEILKSLNLLINNLGMTLYGVRRAYDMGYYDDLLNLAKYYYLVSKIIKQTE